MPLKVDSGGSTGATPGSYSKVGAVSTLKIISGNLTVDAVRLTVREDTYGVVFSFTVPKSTYDALGWTTVAGEYAATVQQYGAFVGTTGISYAPDSNGAGELIDTLIVTVGTDDGFVSIDVQVPLTSSLDSSAMGKIQAAYDAAMLNLVTLG